MKIYTLNYNFNRPTQQAITVGTNTDYMIGVSAEKNGEILELTENDVTITFGNETLTADSVVNGYAVVKYAQGRTPASENAKVNITVDGTTTSFGLNIVGKYSNKGDIEVGAAGGYTAGDGIDISDGEISVDDTIARTNDVNDKINQFAAHYLTKRTGSEGSYSYPQFATHADLAQAKATHTEENPQFFYGDEGHTPDKNDYCVVLADETHGGKTARYAFVGDWDDNGYFRYQYTINETTLDQDQWNAIDSGITSDKLEALETAVTTIPTTTALFEGEYEDGESFSMNVYIA